MLAQERLNDIVRKVNEEGAVRVKELAALYEVTDDCIRKDLTNLEKQGLLKRTHGGALPVRVNTQDLDVEVRRGKHIPEKISIARQALELIHDGDMIYLDISTISLELAKLLKTSPKKITVVSNMIDVLLQLARVPSIKMIFIGGTLNRGYDGFVGCISNEQLRKYNFDIAFMGAVGVNVNTQAVFTYMPEDGITKEVVLERAGKVYLMMETEKFFKDGTYRYARLDQISGILTNSLPAVNIRKQLGELNVELMSPEKN